ncbi:MAG: hypothetical protein WCG55_01440 [bacterium]
MDIKNDTRPVEQRQKIDIDAEITFEVKGVDVRPNFSMTVRGSDRETSIISLTEGTRTVAHGKAGEIRLKISEFTMRDQLIFVTCLSIISKLLEEINATRRTLDMLDLLSSYGLQITKIDSFSFPTTRDHINEIFTQ